MIGMLTSRSFLIPFGIATVLFLMDISLVAWAEASLSISLNPIFGYTSMLIIYAVCVLESLGFSIFIKFVKIIWKNWRNRTVVFQP